MFRYLPICLIIIFSIVSCNRTRPQTPSNKHEAKDSETVSLLLLNQRMAEAADSELSDFVKASQLPFKPDESHLWLYCNDENRAEVLKTGDRIWVDWQTFSLDSIKIEDVSAEIEVGKSPLRALDIALGNMSENEHCTIIAPWYMCYGSTGSNKAGAYKNIRIEITTKNKR